MSLFKGIKKMFQEPTLVDISTTVYLPLERQYGQGCITQSIEFPEPSKLGYTISSIMFTGPGSDLGHKVMLNRRRFKDVTQTEHGTCVVLAAKPHMPYLSDIEKAESMGQHISRVTYMNDIDASQGSTEVKLQAFEHTEHLEDVDYLEVSCHVIDGVSGFEVLFLDHRDSIVKVDNTSCYLSGVTHTRIQTCNEVYFHISAPDRTPLRGMNKSNAYLTIGDSFSARQNNLFVSVELRGTLHATEAADIFKSITGVI